MHITSATSAFSAGGYPTSEVRSRSREDPMPERKRPRGVIPRRRSGAAAKSARLRWRRNSQEELPSLRSGAAAGRSYPTPEARGGSWEEQPHLQGVVGGWVGAGGPRRRIPCSRSEGTGVRRYPSSKIRSSGCALLEQP